MNHDFVAGIVGVVRVRTVCGQSVESDLLVGFQQDVMVINKAVETVDGLVDLICAGLRHPEHLRAPFHFYNVEIW